MVMKQLRIAMVSVHSCPLGSPGSKDTGGMNVYIRQLAQELGRRGHLVDVYTRVHQPEHERVVGTGQNVRLIHLEAIDDERIPKVALYSYLQRFTCGLENFRESENVHYDLIHSHYWLSGLVGKQLQTWWHVPHVAMFHTLGAVKNDIGIGEEEPELRMEGEREVVSDCELIVATTEREKAELVRYYDASPQKVAIIPCGVNLELFRPVDKERARSELSLDHQKVLLFVGRIEPLKGLRQLLRSLTQFAGGKTPSLIVVGGDDYSRGEVQALKKMANELHVESRVSFMGQVDQKRLPVFYSAADVCVIPSYYESFGMVALESLACGTPVLATDVGAMRYIIRHDAMGRVVVDNSPHRLAVAIGQILSSRGEGIGDIEARRSTVAEFDWANIADMVLQEYDRMLEGYRARVTL